MQALTRYSEYFRDRNFFMHFGHVARLAALLIAVVAVQPFVVRHLLREFADLFAVRSKGLGVERMACGT